MTLAQFAWRSPPPSSVDERLLLDEAGASLVVCSPARDDGTVGTFRAEVPPDDRATLMTAGPGEHAFDLLGAATGSEEAALRSAAQRVADLAHGQPSAAAQFGAAAILRAAVPPMVSLTVTGVGTAPAEFHIDPGRITVQFVAGDQPLGWQPAPPPGMGFMTPDADLLGGVGLGATVPPGEFGAIALTVGLPATATRVSIELTGMLHLTVADARQDLPFRVRTPWAPVHHEAS
ncbi:MAG TPA: hypothetical protein VIR16_00175 [Candidatus Limnocylindrales bacterium]